MPPITLRIRSQIGTWRVANVQPTDNFRDLRLRLQSEHDADFHRHRDSFSTDPVATGAAGTGAGAQYLSDDLTVMEAGLRNGDLLFTSVDEKAHESNTGRKTISKDGRILVQHAEQSIQAAGFRPGMLPLRSMKMHWTLNEFVALDEQFVYKLKAPEKSLCSSVKMNTDPLQDIQNYMRNFDYRIIRVAFLFGRFGDDNQVTVEAIYEPPQDCTDISFHLQPDTQTDAVEKISSCLGLKKVGWLFAHPPREKGFFLSGPEVLFAAEQQLEAAGGIGDTAFVTIKLTLDDKGQGVVEAFQVSKQCMEMTAEGVLEVSSNLGSLKINPTFTAVVEGKNVTEVDNSFFLATTPIQQFNSQFLVCTFPRFHRVEVQTRDHLKKQLMKVGKQGWTFTDMIADFELLLFLSRLLSLDDDIPRLCSSVVDRDIPVDEGYELLLRSLAGMD